MKNYLKSLSRNRTIRLIIWLVFDSALNVNCDEKSVPFLSDRLRHATTKRITVIKNYGLVLVV